MEGRGEIHADKRQKDDLNKGKWTNEEQRRQNISAAVKTITVCICFWQATLQLLVMPYHTSHGIPYNAMPYHTMLYNVIPCHAIPCHVMPYHTILYHTISQNTILVMIYHTMPCHTIPCYIMSYNTIQYIPCHVMPCRTMACHVMSCHSMICHAMSCHSMPCHTMSCTCHAIRQRTFHRSTAGRAMPRCLNCAHFTEQLVFVHGLIFVGSRCGHVNICAWQGLMRIRRLEMPKHTVTDALVLPRHTQTTVLYATISMAGSLL